jgi:hypothetical protein
VPVCHTPVGVPPRSWPRRCGPRWTEPPAWSTGHGPSLPIIQYKNNLVYSKEKPSLQRGPCFCLKSSHSPIKFQTAPLEFKSIFTYNPSHFPKSQIGPKNFKEPYLFPRNSESGDSCAKILRITSSFSSSYPYAHDCCIYVIV